MLELFLPTWWTLYLILDFHVICWVICCYFKMCWISSKYFPFILKLHVQWHDTCVQRNRYSKIQFHSQPVDLIIAWENRWEEVDVKINLRWDTLPPPYLPGYSWTELSYFDHLRKGSHHHGALCSPILWCNLFVEVVQGEDICGPYTLYLPLLKNCFHSVCFFSCGTVGFFFLFLFFN